MEINAKTVINEGPIYDNSKNQKVIYHGEKLIDAYMGQLKAMVQETFSSAAVIEEKNKLIDDLKLELQGNKAKPERLPFWTNLLGFSAEAIALLCAIFTVAG